MVQIPCLRYVTGIQTSPDPLSAPGDGRVRPVTNATRDKAQHRKGPPGEWQTFHDPQSGVALRLESTAVYEGHGRSGADTVQRMRVDSAPIEQVPCRPGVKRSEPEQASPIPLQHETDCPDTQGAPSVEQDHWIVGTPRGSRTVGSNVHSRRPVADSASSRERRAAMLTRGGERIPSGAEYDLSTAEIRHERRSG